MHNYSVCCLFIYKSTWRFVYKFYKNTVIKVASSEFTENDKIKKKKYFYKERYMPSMWKNIQIYMQHKNRNNNIIILFYNFS